MTRDSSDSTAEPVDDSRRIVYADPNPRDRETVVRALSELDATVDVDTAPTLSAVLGMLPDADCVVCNVTLPDADGTAAIEAVRARRPELPIVVYTDCGDVSVAGEAIAAGADEYVPERDGIDTLVARVRDTLGSEADGSAFDRLELLLEQSPLAIIEWNLDFEVEHWNPAATELFGFSAAEARGRHAFDLLVSGETFDDLMVDAETMIEAGESLRRVNRNVCKDGSTITCEWFNTPLIDDSGDVLSILSFARDVTDEIKRADALEALQETSHDLMHANSAEKISEITLEATDCVIEGPRASVRLYDEDADHLEPVAATDEVLTRANEEPQPVEPGEGPLWDAYEGGEPVILDEANADMVPYDLGLSIGNGVLHPLGDHGLLTVASPEDSPLDAAEIELVTVLAATAEAALDRAKRQHELRRAKNMVEAVGDSVYALDPDGTVTTVNDTLTEVTGYSEDELVGEHLSTIFTDESWRDAADRINSLPAAADERIVTYEATLETSDGECIPCEVNTTVLQDDGEFVGTVGIVRDVSERKQMERELVARKEKIENLHDVASRLEHCEREDEIYEQTVEAAEGVLNFDVCVVDSVDGDSLVTEAVSEEINASSYTERTPIDQGIAGKTYTSQRTYRIGDLTAAAGATPQIDRYRSVLSVPIGDWGVFQAVSSEYDAFDGHDQELAELLISHVTDALERIAFESKLREERDRFAALFENVPDAVVSTRQEDGEPIVEETNPAFERVFGYGIEELEGRSLDEFIVPADRTATGSTYTRRGARGEIVESEVKRRTTDGLRDFMMRIVPIEEGESVDRTFGVYTDITEQKQRQKRVEILNRVLRHDLRNGMNIINGCAEMLADAVEGDAAEEYALAIQERATELIGLAEKTRAVEQTLDRGDAATGPVDVVDGIENAVERVRDESPAAEIDVSIPDRAMARADDLLTTAIFHVVENAVDHNDLSTPSVTVTLEESDREEETLAIRVADNGPGIPDEERELLQEDKEITQLRHASGLGLWLVNWVVTQSGGRLTFEENEPRGTIVTLEVPEATVAETRVRSDDALQAE